MSQRLVNLCDFATPNVCTSSAVAKCPLCERDACSFHFGGGFAIISLLISVASNNNLTHGVGDVAAMLRARCAAIRLTEDKK